MQITWGSGVRAKMTAGQKGWLESRLQCPHLLNLLLGLGQMLWGRKRERGSSNCECFATSAKNTDEKWQTCIWGCCFSWRICWRCCVSSFVPQRCETSVASSAQRECPQGKWGRELGQNQLIQMNLDDVHIPNGNINLKKHYLINKHWTNKTQYDRLFLPISQKSTFCMLWNLILNTLNFRWLYHGSIWI